MECPVSALVGFFDSTHGLDWLSGSEINFLWAPVIVYCVSFYSKFTSAFTAISLTLSAILTYLCLAQSINSLTVISISVITGLTLIIGIMPLRKVFI